MHGQPHTAQRALTPFAGDYRHRRGGGARPALSPEEAVLLRRFRSLHEGNDTIGDWRRADDTSKRIHAFIAVAMDPGVLDQLDSPSAHDLARMAQAFARKLLEVTGDAADPDCAYPSTAAACRIVAAIVSAWFARPQSSHAREPAA